MKNFKILIVFILLFSMTGCLNKKEDTTGSNKEYSSSCLLTVEGKENFYNKYTMFGGETKYSEVEKIVVEVGRSASELGLSADDEMYQEALNEILKGSEFADYNNISGEIKGNTVVITYDVEKANITDFIYNGIGETTYENPEDANLIENILRHLDYNGYDCEEIENF
ncbi:MAG: hypothetical protein ACK5KQ_02650 [Anaerorhabdus sp.]